LSANKELFLKRRGFERGNPSPLPKGVRGLFPLQQVENPDFVGGIVIKTKMSWDFGYEIFSWGLCIGVKKLLTKIDKSCIISLLI
jgi:hypothetical protein